MDCFTVAYAAQYQHTLLRCVVRLSSLAYDMGLPCFVLRFKHMPDCLSCSSREDICACQHESEYQEYFELSE